MLLFLRVSVLLDAICQAHWSPQSGTSWGFPHTYHYRKELHMQGRGLRHNEATTTTNSVFKLGQCLSCANLDDGGRKRARDERCWAPSPGKARWPCPAPGTEGPRGVNHSEELSWGAVGHRDRDGSSPPPSPLSPPKDKREVPMTRNHTKQYSRLFPLYLRLERKLFLPLQ